MGQIHVYTGDGKGKTTAAFGMAVRALGRGKKVAIIQFLKPKPSGEIIALSKVKKFKQKLIIKSYGSNQFVKKVTPLDIKEAKRGLKEAEKILKKQFDLVILDEINIAIAFGLIDLNKVINIIESRPIGTNVVLTGRRAHLKMMELADVVTEMKKIKHPYDKGKKAIMGIEY
jgi:cob(I)alamin adenosyltransferase